MSEEIKEGYEWNTDDPDIKIFAEYVIFDEKNLSRSEAVEYLNLWEKVILKKFTSELYEVELIDEVFGEKEVASLAKQTLIYLKISVKAKWKFELPK